jgi:hypothetical protein
MLALLRLLLLLLVICIASEVNLAEGWIDI